MNNRWKKRSSVVIVCMLIVLLLVSSINMAIAAEREADTKLYEERPVGNVNEAYFANVKGTELMELRDEFTRHYKQDDGSITAYVNKGAMHYRDGDTYRDIDLSIVPSKDDREYAYENVTNTVKTFFANASGLKEGKVAKFQVVNEKGQMRSVAYQFPKASASHEELKGNRIVYKNVFNDTDLEYRLSPDMLKENVIVHAPQEQYVYDFYLHMDGLRAELRKDGGIDFIDVDSKEVLWEISPPVAEDSSEIRQHTYQLTYKLEDVKVDGQALTKLTLRLDDPEFIEKAVFPIHIDPTTTLSRTSGWIIGPYNFAQSDSVSTNAFPGFVNFLTDEYRFFLNFNLSGIPQNAMIDSALLQVNSLGKLGSAPGASYVVKRLTSNFIGTSFSNLPSYTDDHSSTIYTTGGGLKQWDLTDMIQEVVTDQLPFHGVSIQATTPPVLYAFYTDTTDLPKLVVTYHTNNPPVIHVNSPLPDAAFSETDAVFNASVTVSDQDNDPLTVQLFVNSESSPRATQTVTNTSTAKTITFPSIDISALPEGNHTLWFEVKDAAMFPVIKSVSIKMDRSPPVITTFQPTPASNAITVQLQAVDALAGLDVAPYRYTIGTTASAWTAGTSFTHSNLDANEAYTLTVEAKDAKGHIATDTKNVYTKALIPQLNVDAVTGSSVTFSYMESNPIGTEYQVKSGSSYVQSDGTLGAASVWLPSDATKTLVVSGLQANQNVVFEAKARNHDLVETDFGTPISVTTFEGTLVVPQNVAVTGTSNVAHLIWDAVTGANGYDIEVNGQVLTSVTGTSYSQYGLNPNTTYDYRVRAKNATSVGDWSPVYTYTTGATIYTIQMIEDQTVHVTLKANRMEDFSNISFVLDYDAAELDVVDLSAFTWAKETTVGAITGTPITITAFTPGQITFQYNQPIAAGNMWSGTVNIIAFKAKQTGTTDVTYTMN